MNKTVSTTAIPRVSRNSSREEEVTEYIQKQLGPQHLPLIIVLPMTFIYVSIFITGVIGNLAICRVIAKNSSMHTTTNYYLFSLAVSDLSLLVLGLPYDVSLYYHQYPWVMGQALCKFRALISEMASYTSVLTIVAFSMERYLAICHPLHSFSMSGLRRALKIIAVLWGISLLAASPFAVFTQINYLEYPENSGNYLNETAFCAMLAHNLPEGTPIYELSFLLFFLLPMVIIFVLYMLIGKKIQSRGEELGSSIDGSSVHRDARHLRSKKNIIRMLMAVVITFFVCWFPFHAQRLFYLHGTGSEFYAVINEWAFYITGILYYMSATMNPILYNVMSVKYRTAFKQTLTCGSNSNHKRRRRSTLNRSNTTNVILRSGSAGPGEKLSRKGGSSNSFSSHCDSNAIDKNQYQPVPVENHTVFFKCDGSPNGEERNHQMNASL